MADYMNDVFTAHGLVSLVLLKAEKFETGQQQLDLIPQQ